MKISQRKIAIGCTLITPAFVALPASASGATSRSYLAPCSYLKWFMACLTDFPLGRED